MTNYYYIILPVIYGYVMQQFCPFVNRESVEKRRQELTQKGVIGIYEVIWPLLFLMIGFSWFFARQKADIVKSLVSNKGSREAVVQFGKLFGKMSQTTALDTAYTIFTALIGWWLVLNKCTTNRRNDMLVLFLTSASGGLLLYLITSYGKKGLFALIPVVMWLFFANEYNIREYINNED